MPIGAFKLNSIAKYLASSSRTAKTITRFGNTKVSSTQSKFGGTSAFFDGTSDWLESNSYNDLNFGTGNFTIECWYYLANTTGAKYIIASQDNTSYSWAIYQNGGSLLYYLSSTSESWNIANGLTMKSGLVANTWYHIALVRNGNTFTPYVGGVAGITATSSAALFDKRYITIGGLKEGSSAWMNGYIDEVRISSIARYTAGFTPSATAFTNDSNTRLLLHCGGANNATQFIDDTGSRLPINVDEIFGGELDTAQIQFGSASWYQDAEYDGFTINDESTIKNIGTGDYTIECWVRRQDNPTTTQATIFDFVSGFSKLFYNESTNQLIFSTQSTNRITGGSLSLNTWSHVAITRSSGTVKLYINGTQSGSSYSTDSGDFNNITQVLIGCDNNGLNSWVGHIDELRISNIARYTGNFTVPISAFTNDTNTLVLFHMDGTDATTIILDDNS